MKSNLMDLARRTYQSGKNRAAAVGSVILLVGSQAHAALPAEATAAFTSLSTNVSDVLAAIWPIVGAVVAGFGLIKLFKKGAGKAV